MKITDDMVEAALMEAGSQWGEFNSADNKRALMRAALTAALSEAPAVGVKVKSQQPHTCQRCQGNGEIVTDWDRYMRGHEDENGNEAVAECPDCGGEGIIDDQFEVDELTREEAEASIAAERQRRAAIATTEGKDNG